MPEFVCVKACQLRINGKIVTIEHGTVIELDELSDNKDCFYQIGVPEYVIDFAAAGEEELQAADWKFKEAQAAIYQAFGVKLKWEEGMKKSEVIAQIMDARYRSLDSNQAKAKAGQPIPENR